MIELAQANAYRIPLRDASVRVMDDLPLFAARETTL